MTIVALIVIIITVVLLLREYQVHAVLFLAGFVLLLLTHMVSQWTGELPPSWRETNTGWVVFDLFALVKDTFALRVGEIGLIVMAAGGFARYMNKIAASDALVSLAIIPLRKIRHPYFLLALSYTTGQILNIFIPSAAGLAMLLLVAMYPTLVRLGLRPVAVASVIGTTSCLDLGPASGASNLAATVCGLDPVIYFFRYQLPVAALVIPTIALLHFFWQDYCDRREPEPVAPAPVDPVVAKAASNAPPAYALLPLLPLVLLMVFSPLAVTTIRIDVVSAMFFSLAAGMVCEMLRLRSFTAALSGITHFFQGMGEILAKVVTLIVAAEIFAAGVQASGLVDGLLHLVETFSGGNLALVLALCAIIGGTALITGSGNAALFSFSHLVPGLAKGVGSEAVSLMLPCQLAAGLFRSMSPVSGVIIVVAGAANVSPLRIVRRTAIPMAGGMIALLLARQFLL